MALSAALLGIAWLLFPFPKERLERWAVSPTVLDVKGRAMLSIVGSSEQWHRPVRLDSMSPWLIQATIAVEDERFYSHFGVDPLAVIRAAAQNIAARRIVSGASTLNMQLCRMMDNRPRTLWAKIVESFRAIQLDRLMRKDEIIELYLNVAPYGGNLRGVEAASLAYFGKHAKDLSLGEAALIAGLPQSPSRYRPNRHPQAALKRQKVVLHRMFEEGMITDQQLQEARVSPITPLLAFTRNQGRAVHAAWLALRRRPQGGRTTIDLDIQDEVEWLSQEHLRQLPADTELAVVVIDIAESAIIAMVGSGDPSDPVDGQVNGALAKRSPGSTLKPFIYATAFEMGRLNGESIVHDIPISRGGWSPLNFERTFSGRVTVADALRRSLNVPAILVAEGVGLAGCCGVLEAAGVRLPPDAQRRGGLALVVGGIEVTLLDLTNAYATLGRRGIRKQPRLFTDEPIPDSRFQIADLRASSIEHRVSPVRRSFSEGGSIEYRDALASNVCDSINNILSSRHRRPCGMEQILPEQVPWFMWKTGTSAGRRDAWAVGHNYRYAIGVWVGRFRGTGRAAYVGAEAAEPLLAGLFNLTALRTNIDPPPSMPIRVRHPLSLPVEMAQSIRITSPGSGDTFISLDGKAVIHPSANRPDGLLWFLNGRLLEDNRTARLSLSPGHYELRCIDPKGQSSSVSFTVVGAPAAIRMKSETSESTKHEIRNPKQYRMTKTQMTKTIGFENLNI